MVAVFEVFRGGGLAEFDGWWCWPGLGERKVVGRASPIAPCRLHLASRTSPAAPRRPHLAGRTLFADCDVERFLSGLYVA